MKNIKLSLLTLTTLFIGFVNAQTVYDFSNASSLETDWTIVKDKSAYECAVQSAAYNGISPIDGNMLGFGIVGASGSITMTSTKTFTGVSQISFKFATTDSSNPNFTIKIGGTEVVSATTPKKATPTAAKSNKDWAEQTATVSNLSGQIVVIIKASSSGKYAALDNLTITAGPSVSSDATLSDLKVDGTSISGFTAATTSYNVTVPASATTAPVVSAIANDSKASIVYTQATLPAEGASTTATVKVTAEDGTTKTYTVTFTRAAVSHDATLSDIKIDGVSLTGFIASTLTYSYSVPYSQTALPVVSATATNAGAQTPVITQTTSVPGTATIAVTAEDGTTTKTYTVSFTRATASNDATLKTLTYNGTSVPGFSAATTSYSIELTYGSATPVVAATTNYIAATASITQPTSTNSTATIVVKAEDGTTTKTYTITFTEADEPVGPPVPSTDLTTHMPGVYDEKSIAGGYDGTLTIFNSREYEVYYCGKDNESAATINLIPAEKIDGIATTRTETSCSRDWFSGQLSGISNYTYVATDEFIAGSGAMHKMANDNTYTFHIKGYDQFTVLGKDKKVNASKNQYYVLDVYIDDVKQTTTYDATAQTIRRYDITTGEHVIRVVGAGSSNSEFYAFSLRIAQEPRIKKIKGNDSTQVIYHSLAPKPVYYFTKYNSLGETKIVWDGTTATGITLTTTGSSSIGDTLMLGGNANCPAGTYNFHVAAFYKGKETNSVPGSFTVVNMIQAQTDTVSAFEAGESVTFKFRYYAEDSDVTLTWGANGQPAGVTYTLQNGILLVSGICNTIGKYPFTVGVTGGNTIPCECEIVAAEVMGANPILYIINEKPSTFRTSNHDGVYQYFKSVLSDVHAKDTSYLASLTTADYAKFPLIILSESVQANSPKIISIAKGDTKRPVLNMSAFTYSLPAEERLGWGDPNNGSLVNTKVFVNHADHPIFKNFSSEIEIISAVDKKGLMPIAINNCPGSICLALAYTRNKEDYEANGELATFIHEVPANLRNGAKYLSFPLATASSEKLTASGKLLLKACADYLMSTTASPVQVPELGIASYSINGTAGQILSGDTIRIDLPETTSKTGLQPAITLLDPTYTHVTPTAAPFDYAPVGDSRAMYLNYTVSDYIQQRKYVVIVAIRAAQGIEDIYTDGEWVNVFDIYGRLITTTNESVNSIELPHGLYIVRTSRGSFKVMK